MPAMPEIAVLIPVYRNQGGLDSSLESLRRAKGGFDVVIVDDGSESPMQVTPGNRTIKAIRLQQNAGISTALNRGLEWIAQRGYRFVARLDAGDTVHPERFIKQLTFLKQNPEYLLVSSWTDFVDTEGNLLFHHRVPPDHDALMSQMRLNNCLIHPAVMFRTTAAVEVGFYNPAAQVSEDYDFFLRLGGHGRVAALQEVLTFCEYNYNGITVRKRREQQRERLRLQLRYFDSSCLLSYLGVLRTLVALAMPHDWSVEYKRRTMGAPAERALV